MENRLTPCSLCPRRCGADRQRGEGFCGASEQLEVSAVTLHRGEEPPLVGPEGKGIVNIFFAHCNLQCVYCQNYEISGRTASAVERLSVGELADRVCALLPQSSGLVGFVTAAHYADRLADVVEAIRIRGFSPASVYNSSGYESVEALQRLEGVIDIYLPDLKYRDAQLAQQYSHAADYPQVSALALAEMARQVGCGLKQADGVAYRGMIVRHLVLPGAVQNSLDCLDWLADHLNPFSLHLSLMAQYFPPRAGLPAPLDRTLLPSEYAVVRAHAEALGFERGWLQSLEAEQCYRPHFADAHPFEPHQS